MHEQHNNYAKNRQMSGDDEGCDMLEDHVVIDMSDEDQRKWKAVFKKLMVMDMNDNQEIRIESLVKVIMSLNDSTLSYWWRGGMPLDR